jgi:hypothetical protein
LLSRLYLTLTACSLALVAFVVTRAPLWNPVMAGALVSLDGGELALVPTAWQCSSEGRCVTTLAGEPLQVVVPAIGAGLLCDAVYRAHPVSCAVVYWYAPQPKPFVRLGVVPEVSFPAAILERPWRLLELQCLGEQGALPGLAGLICFFLLGLAAGAALTRCSWSKRSQGGMRVVWWILGAALGLLTFVALNVGWFVTCFSLGYID